VQPAKQELVLERTFNAPRDLVFKVWTDPGHLAKWWGPKDYTNPVCELDLRVGGAIRIDMQSPDGVVIPSKGFFNEIIPPEKLVFTLTNFEDEAGVPQLEIRNTVTFEEANGKTKLTLRAVIVKATSAVSVPLSEMETGWTQSLDRLADVLKNA
jgi:uncharacterized protein YndB with AHSA1/START domain